MNKKAGANKTPSLQKRAKKQIIFVLVIFLAAGLGFWGANIISKNKMQAQAEADTKAAETYEIYQGKYDAIIAGVSSHPDRPENMSAIKSLLDLQNLVTENKESFKMYDGSLSYYDTLQAAIQKSLEVYKAKVVADYEAFYNYAQLSDDADSYSVEKCLGVMKQLMENLETDAKVTNVFPTAEIQAEYIQKAQERHDNYAKRHEANQAETR